MPTYKRIRMLITTLWFLCWMSPSALSFANPDPILIHHPGLKGEDFSTRSLVRIYAMKKRYWEDGTPITVFTLSSDSGTHKEFVTEYLRMQPYQLNRLWHRLVFSGTGSTPVELASLSAMLDKVESTPGAIGYIDSSMADKISEAMTAGGSND